ncbi:CehA/McbA family metallohydrolase [Solimonas terrae]|uniref:CehA/McbA family metallohydrolase n=1 Tax=Solimonas terrae TaxID=1396819 RepID=A0A6M2BXA3_9GAMM|nr:CehA/McbA family metallohydrolase [Solimonas terrae]NGY06773.1 CehA/McbA family metallohydrolase [Solimonas terrae]
MSITAGRCLPFRSDGTAIVLALLAALAACGRSPSGTDGSAGSDPYHLGVTLDGDGDVHSSTAGIDCGPSCSASFAPGSSVTLFATAAGDAQFDHWSGACSGPDDCVLTMDGDRQVVAHFVAPAAAAPSGVWLKGDLHVHDDHSSDGSLPRQLISQAAPGNNPVSAQIGEAERVGLDFMALTDHRTYDQQYDPLWQSSKLILLPGEEANGSPHATVQGAVDSIVQGANPDGAPEFYNLQQSIWDAHSQDAVWVTAHPDDGEMNDDGTPNARANAQGMDLVEAWNRASSPDRELDYCENRWNAGFRFGIAGASDDHFIELWAIGGPGTPNTRVYAAAASARGILDGLHRGHVGIAPDALSPVVTLAADADGDGIYEAIGGDELTVPAGSTVRLRLRVQQGIGDTVTLYAAPGRSAGPLQRFTPTRIDQSFDIDYSAPDTPGWLRAEVRGPGLIAGIDTSDLTSIDGLTAQLKLLDQLRAIDSPIFIGPELATPQAEQALPAALGDADGAQWVAGARDRYAGFADVAISNGIAHVVLETHDHTASRIVYRARDAKGNWYAAPRVISGDSTTARFARVAARGDDVDVVWQDESAGEAPHRPQIVLRHSGDGGASWQPLQTIRAIDGRAEHPALTLDGDGRPVIAWQEITAGEPFDVYVQILGRDATPQDLSRDGKTISAGNPLDARSPRDPASVWPALATAPDGRIAVAWQDNRDDPDPLWTGATGSGDGSDPDNWQIEVRTRAADADAWSAMQTLGAADHADRHPSLAFADDGTLVAAWDSKTLQSSGANLSIQSARSADGGASFDAPLTVAPQPQAMSQYPRLGVDADGRVRAVWYDSRAADWRWRVMSSRLDSGGWGADQLLLSPGINTWPATSGGLLVFSSTRNAQRIQRDRTQQIFLLDLAR